MSKKFIGGLLLIIGTSIGAGMLALPVATAQAGFLDTLLFLFIAWAVMLMGALYILEVNLCLPEGANMVSMAEATLGPAGKVVTWLSYLFLLYTLLCGYISGGGDVFHAILSSSHFAISESLSTIIYVLIFALVVYTGMKAVDNTNSFLMYSKISIFVLLLIFIFPHVHISQLKGGNLWQIKPALMLLFTAYGFAIIVPSLREYFHSDINTLKRLIIVGSLFPLMCYIAWNAAIMGVIPKTGHPSLLELFQSKHTSSELSDVLAGQIQNSRIGHLFRLFSGISMLTAFLGVSLCLFDFLADGLKLKREKLQGGLLLLLVFLPPLLIVLKHPGIYLSALSYAGYACVVLLLLLPALMAAFSRLKNPAQNAYRVPGGYAAISLVSVTAIALLCVTLFDWVSSLVSGG